MIEPPQTTRCPQCGAEVPILATKCTCCSKSFLMLSGRRKKEKKARPPPEPAEQQEQEEPKERSRDEILAEEYGDDRDPATTFLLATTAILSLFILAFWLRGSTPRNTGQTRAPGLSMGSVTTEDSTLPAARSKDLGLSDRSLLPGKEIFEARGLLTNPTDRTLRWATLETHLTGPRGKPYGKLTGEVRSVKPGETVEFSTSGSPEIPLHMLSRTRWRTRIVDVHWRGL